MNGGGEASDQRRPGRIETHGADIAVAGGQTAGQLIGIRQLHEHHLDAMRTPSARTTSTHVPLHRAVGVLAELRRKQRDPDLPVRTRSAIRDRMLDAAMSGSPSSVQRPPTQFAAQKSCSPSTSAIE